MEKNEKAGTLARWAARCHRHPWLLIVLAVVWWFVPTPEDFIFVVGLADEVLLTIFAAWNIHQARKARQLPDDKGKADEE